MNQGHFNIRVYGIMVNHKKEVLLSDEYVLNTYMTKFPGGGLEFGEGPEDCLRREAIEEFGQEIEVLEHFYTTHFYQPALFYKNTQLLSIYYTFRFIGPIQFMVSKTPLSFKNTKEGSQVFRWESLKTLNTENMTFPIDRHVAQLLKEKYQE
jgi:8-oxo-dGTP diphosphatase